ncbi:LysR substrate-binding domain-containing protein [Actinomadura kijaniata]|uniref:LysR substrate-binding domain-containing protein n=1 Tax=Actinomadura kijaniata TaxID=46161 RepID=UPI003F1CA4FE
MELRQLRYFVTVAEELHFGRAAERLTIVQSAVSQQIGRLERELGVTLFDRSPRRVRLTEAGAAFLPAAHEVLDAERRARAAVEGFRADRAGTLRLGTSRGMGERLERVLAALERHAPGVRVALGSAAPEERLRRVAGGEWDAAFARGEPAVPEGVRLVPVWQDELLVALPARHPLAAADAIDLAGLADVPLLLVGRRRNPPLVDLVTGACREAGFTPPPGPGYSSLQDTLAALGAGVPAWSVVYAEAARQVRNDRVAFRPVRSPAPLSLPTVLAMRAGDGERLRPLLAACRDAARDDHDS